MFLTSLQHFEGEWRVGLGRRTFNASLDTAEAVEVGWFELKSVRARNGKAARPTNPMFRKTKNYNGRQAKGMKVSLERLADFLEFNVSVTEKSHVDEPNQLKIGTVRALICNYSHLRRTMPQEGGEQGELQRGAGARTVRRWIRPLRPTVSQNAYG